MPETREDAKPLRAGWDRALSRQGNNAASGRCAQFDFRGGAEIGQTWHRASIHLRKILTAEGAEKFAQNGVYSGMIFGAHVLFYSQDPEADRAFFSDVLGLRSVDVGHGWLIFAMPPAEAAIHPADGEFSQTHGGHELMGAVLYLMCDDLTAEIAALQRKNVQCTEIQEAPWGSSTTIPLPSGRAIGLYQPRHETALNLNWK